MRVAAVAFGLVMAAATLARTETCGPPTVQSDGWQVGAPAQQGLDPTLICNIGRRLEGWKEADPHGVVIVRNGVLVYEHYFSGEDEPSVKGSGALFSMRAPNMICVQLRKRYLAACRHRL